MHLAAHSSWYKDVQACHLTTVGADYRKTFQTGCRGLKEEEEEGEARENIEIQEKHAYDSRRNVSSDVSAAAIFSFGRNSIRRRQVTGELEMFGQHWDGFERAWSTL